MEVATSEPNLSLGLNFMVDETRAEGPAFHAQKAQSRHIMTL